MPDSHLLVDIEFKVFPEEAEIFARFLEKVDWLLVEPLVADGDETEIVCSMINGLKRALADEGFKGEQTTY